MAFNGSGVFARLYTWITDRDSGIKIQAQRMDDEMDGMATGLSNCITKDGQTTVTQNIPMNSKKFTGLAAGSSSNDSVSFSQIRSKLSGSLNYYVRTDGSDSNTGLANSAGGAFLTIQKAVDTVANTTDLVGNSAVVNVGAGTFTGAVNVGGSFAGQGPSNSITIAGAGSSTIVSVTGGNCVTASNGVKLVLSNFKVTTATSGDCISANTGAEILTSGIEYGASAGVHNSVGSGAIVQAFGNYSISGNADAHVHMPNGGQYLCNAITITLTTTIAWGSYFVGLRGCGYADFKSVTFAGSSATGIRGVIHFGSVLDTENQTTDFLPGNGPVTVARGGIYVANPPSVAADASYTYGITLGGLLVIDGVGGAALISYRTVGNNPKVDILAQNSTSFTTTDPGSGGNKWWVQPSGLFTNRFVGTNTLSIAPITPHFI